jgi:hypothetical protein
MRAQPSAARLRLTRASPRFRIAGMGSWKPTHPKRRDRTAAGLVPTLAQLAHGSSWLWARCPERGCSHDAAIPLKPVMAQFGSEASSDRLRAALRCTICGHRGALLQLPSWGMSEGYRATPPLDRIPLALRRQMAKDALQSIGAEVRP